jgi:hypothetical protein
MRRYDWPALNMEEGKCNNGNGEVMGERGE